MVLSFLQHGASRWPRGSETAVLGHRSPFGLMTAARTHETHPSFTSHSESGNGSAKNLPETSPPTYPMSGLPRTCQKCVLTGRVVFRIGSKPTETGPQTKCGRKKGTRIFPMGRSLMTQCDQKCVRSGDKGSLHLDILKQGVEAWNRWREDQPDVQPDLREANLRGVNLQGANFQDAKFNAAILVNTHLSDVDFTRACLDGAQLHGANLSRANLSFATCIYTMFVGANLSGASLLFTNFTLAFLIGASLHEAYLGDTIFASIDLCAVEG